MKNMSHFLIAFLIVILSGVVIINVAFTTVLENIAYERGRQSFILESLEASND